MIKLTLPQVIHSKIESIQLIGLVKRYKAFTLFFDRNLASKRQHPSINDDNLQLP